MEQAIFIANKNDIKYADSKYTRIYFGAEFCQNLIPCLEGLKFIMDFASKNKKDLTLVTPYVTNRGIDALRPLLEYAVRRAPRMEIVVNDWGVLRMAKKDYAISNFVLGRLLTKQKRGPRISNLTGIVPEEMMDHFKKASVDNPPLREFLAGQGINRIELDNLLQGLIRPSDSLKASLYVPFAYITTTRYCLTAPKENKEARSFRSISSCNKECQAHLFHLEQAHMPVKIFLKGNTQFFKNENLPNNLEGLNIDRLVYQPAIF